MKSHYLHTGVGKSRFTVVSSRHSEFIPILLFFFIQATVLLPTSV